MKRSQVLTLVLIGIVFVISILALISNEVERTEISTIEHQMNDEMNASVRGSQSASVVSDGNVVVSGKDVIHSSSGDTSHNIGGDFSVSVDGGVSIVTTEKNANSVHVDSAGGIILTSRDYPIVFDSGKDLKFESDGTTVKTNGNVDAALQFTTNSGGIGIHANSNKAHNIFLESLGGTASSIKIRNATGTSTTADNAESPAVHMHSLVGGIGIAASGGKKHDIFITSTGAATGGTAGSIYLLTEDSTQVLDTTSSGTISSTYSSIQLQSESGGISLLPGSTGVGETAALNMHAASGGINMKASVASATAITLNAEDTVGGVHVNSGTGGFNCVSTGLVKVDTDGKILLDTSDTSADAFKVDASTGAGGVLIESGTSGFNSTSTGITNIHSSLNSSSAIYVHANGGTSSRIRLHQDTGTATDSIHLESDAGGIYISASTNVTISNGDLYGYNGGLAKIKGFSRDVVTSGTLSESQSGAFLMPATSGGAATFTLPGASGNTGCHFTFISRSAENHVINAGANGTIYGYVIDSTNDGGSVDTDDISNASSITLVNGSIGDKMEFFCDGSNWYVSGITKNTPSTN